MEKYEKALEIYHALIKEYDEGKDIYSILFEMGMTYLLLDEYQNSIEFYLKCIDNISKLGSKDDYWMYEYIYWGLGENYKKTFKYTDAINYYLKAYEYSIYNRSNGNDYLKDVGEIYLINKNYSKYIKYYFKIKINLLIQSFKNTFKRIK